MQDHQQVSGFPQENNESSESGKEEFSNNDTLEQQLLSNSQSSELEVSKSCNNSQVSTDQIKWEIPQEIFFNDVQQRQIAELQNKLSKVNNELILKNNVQIEDKTYILCLEEEIESQYHRAEEMGKNELELKSLCQDLQFQLLNIQTASDHMSLSQSQRVSQLELENQLLQHSNCNPKLVQNANTDITLQQLSLGTNEQNYLSLIDQLEAENKSLRSELALLEQKMQEYTDFLKLNKNWQAKLSDEVQTLKQTIILNETQISEMERANTVSEVQQIDIESNQISCEQTDTQNIANTPNSNFVAQLKKQLQIQKQVNQNLSQSLQTKQNELTSMTTQLSQLQDQNSILSCDNQSLNYLNEQMILQLDEKQNTINLIQQQLNDENSCNSCQYKLLKENNRNVQQENDTLTTLINDMNQQYQSEIEKLQQNQNTQLSTANMILTTTNVVTQHIEQTAASPAQLTENEIDALRSQLADQQIVYDDLWRENDQLIEDKLQLTNLCSELEGQLQAKQSQPEAKSKQCIQQEKTIQTLQKQLENLQSLNAESQATETIALQSAVQTLQSQNQQYCNQLQQMRVEQDMFLEMHEQSQRNLIAQLTDSLSVRKRRGGLGSAAEVEALKTQNQQLENQVLSMEKLLEKQNVFIQAVVQEKGIMQKYKGYL